jgi:hypothetical protein
MSKVWFGVIHSSSIDDNDDLYDKMVFTPTNYTIIGKLKNGGQLTILKFIYYFETPKSIEEVDYLSLKLHKNLHNTFVPISLENFNIFSDAVKQLDYSESGIHPVTRIDYGDAYNSEKDSDYSSPESESSEDFTEEDSDEEEEPDEENEDDEENDECVSCSDLESIDNDEM